MDAEDLDFTINIPTVHIETESFSADVIEMYEMPSKMIMPLIGHNGFEQMEALLDIFKLAVIDQSKVADLDFLSFNEMSNVLMEWWVGSSMRVEKQARGLEKKMARLDEQIQSAKEVLDDMVGFSENEETGITTFDYEGKKLRFRVSQTDDGDIEILMVDGPAENDPGDDISPFDS